MRNSANEPLAGDATCGLVYPEHPRLARAARHRSMHDVGAVQCGSVCGHACAVLKLGPELLSGRTTRKTTKVNERKLCMTVPGMTA
jgi:hypothetical protein